MRTCTECPTSLDGRPVHTKTCSTACRAKRSRRLKREAARQADERRSPEHHKAVREATKDLVRPIVAEELRPVVRESITEDVLRSVQRLLGLAPRVVELIAEDLESNDPVLRQRAYTLVSKYTLGHPALLRPEDATGEKQLVVNFAMPRPEATVVESSAVELELDDDFRQCDTCGEDKPITEFVAGSHRCVTCFAAQRERAARLGDGSAD